MVPQNKLYLLHF